MCVCVCVCVCVRVRVCVCVCMCVCVFVCLHWPAENSIVQNSILLMRCGLAVQGRERSDKWQISNSLNVQLTNIRLTIL